MTTRLKTLQYPVQGLITSTLDATPSTLGLPITIYIPETVIAFQNVTVDIGFQDLVTATGGTIDEHRVSVSLNGFSTSATVTETDDIAHTAEQLGGIVGPFDFTSYFVTTWSGTSMPLSVSAYFDQSTGTTLGMANVNAIVTITYSYDDDPAVNATQIKTAWIPLESIAGALPTVANTNMGTNQIPIMTGVGGILPESGVVIRNYSFVIEGNQAVNASTTALTVSANIDSGTAYAFQQMTQTLASDRFTRLIWTPSVVPTTTTVHNFQLWGNVARFNHPCVMLFVTYEFNVAASTRILNSVVLPVEVTSPLGNNVVGRASRIIRNYMAQEPGTLALVQSAFRVNWNPTNSITGLAFRAGAQAYRSVTNAGSVICGMYSYQQRVDAGSAQGVGITLARGNNTWTIDGYSTDTVNMATNVSGYVVLNYHSDKSPVGVGQHANTVFRIFSQWDAALATYSRVTGFSFQIPETNYWLISSGFVFTMWSAPTTTSILFDVECKSSEGKGGGYYDLYVDTYVGESERSCSIVWARGADVFKRHTQDPDTSRIDIETARDFRLSTPTATAEGALALATYHSFYYTSTFNITNSGGGLVTIKLFRADNDEFVASTSRTGNGTVAISWYDNSVLVYAAAYESNTRIGRSPNFIIGT